MFSHVVNLYVDIDKICISISINIYIYLEPETCTLQRLFRLDDEPKIFTWDFCLEFQVYI